MSKFALIYLGPRGGARADVVGMLKAFPTAMFVEKEEGLFEVTADSRFGVDVSVQTKWHAEELTA